MLRLGQLVCCSASRLPITGNDFVDCPVVCTHEECLSGDIFILTCFVRRHVREEDLLLESVSRRDISRQGPQYRMCPRGSHASLEHQALQS
jgi:hypothetical protein